MALNGSLVRCVKHPSHLSLGFCSLCLVERLSIVGLTKDNLDPINNSRCEILEVSVATPTLDEKKEKPKTTLLALFELDDLRNSTTKMEVESTHFSSKNSLKGVTVEVKYRMKLLNWRKNGAPVEKKESRDTCSIESPIEKQMRRSSSLRCACEWIVCCNCESTKTLYNRSKLWDGGTIFPLGLKRSLSESGNHRRLLGDQIAQKVSSVVNSRSQRIDMHKKKMMLGRSFSLRSASTCSPNKSNNGLIKFYLSSLKSSRKRANDDNSMKKKNVGTN
jgi:hypothetical protein